MNREERIREAELSFENRIRERQSLKRIIKLDNIEKQVMRCIKSGLRTTEIAEVLKVGYSTVTYARQRVHEKLDTRTVTEAIFLIDKLELI